MGTIMSIITGGLSKLLDWRILISVAAIIAFGYFTYQWKYKDVNLLKQRIEVLEKNNISVENMNRILQRKNHNLEERIKKYLNDIEVLKNDVENYKTQIEIFCEDNNNSTDIVNPKESSNAGYIVF